MTIEQRVEVLRSARLMRACLIVLVILAACTTTDNCCWKASRHDPVHLSSLMPDWKLYRTFWDDIGAPAEAFLKLVAVRGADEKCVVLTTTTSLAGLVRIKTAEQALEFVRLFTDGDTIYLFDDAEFTEVQPVDEDDLPRWDELQALGSGKIARKEFDDRGFKEPHVHRDGEDFIIRRYMASPIKGEGFVSYLSNVFLVEERVQADGKCSRSAKLIAKRVRVSTPGYF